MAVIEKWYRQDLQQPVRTQHLDGSMFSHNGNGNRIGVELYNGGEPLASITGTVSGYVVTEDGTTVPCTGAKSGNKASILIPAAAYQPGNVFISIFLTDGTTVTTLAAVQTTVLQTRTGTQVDPGTAVTDWTQTINAAMQSVEDAADNLGGIIAVPYSSITFPVPFGKYTYYNDNLYRCISPIASSEDWTAAHWTQVRLGDDVSDLKSAMNTQSVALVPNINSASIWESGGIFKNTGINVDNATRARTKGYLQTNADTITFGDGRRAYILAYGTDGTYIGAYKSGTGYVKDGTETYVSSGFKISDLINANPTYRFRIEMIPTNGVNISSGEYAGFGIKNVIYNKFQTIEQNMVTKTENSTINLLSQNINSVDMWESGAILTSNGSNFANISRLRTKGYLPTNTKVVRVSDTGIYAYVLAYSIDGTTYYGALKSDGTFVKDGSETGYNEIDISFLLVNHPTYRFRLSVFKSSGSLVLSDCEDFIITNALSECGLATNVRVIQYNIGKFNWGGTAGLPNDQYNVPQKIMNYKKLFASENADIITLQEYPATIDRNGIYGTDSVLFDPLFKDKSYYMGSTYQIMYYSQSKIMNSAFSFFHKTSGDTPCWCVYGDMLINQKKVAVVSAVMGAVEAAETQKRLDALEKLTTNILSGYDYAIIGMDTNAFNESEASAIRTYMESQGYVCANWYYLGWLDTYVVNSGHPDPESVYKKIDNVFVKGGKIVNIQVPDVYADLTSDHLPIVVDIRL